MDTSKIAIINKSINLNKRPILKKILENSEPLQENVVDFIEKTENFKEIMVGIIEASGKDAARLAGVVMNSAFEVPVQIVKLECIQDALIEIRQKLVDMPVEDLYKVYTSSSPAAIALGRVKTKLDDAIDNFQNEQCKKNIPKVMSEIDIAYNAAKAASAAIDRISGESAANSSQPQDKRAGGAKSLVRKYHRRQNRTHKTRRYKRPKHKIHRNKKKTRSRTTRRKNKYKRKTR